MPYSAKIFTISGQVFFKKYRQILTNILSDIKVLLSYILILIAFYSPLLFSYHLSVDDWALLEWHGSNTFGTLWVGRPIFGIILGTLCLPFLNQISDGNFLRFLSFCTLALLTFMLFKLFSQNLDKKIAFLISGLIMILPSFQTYISFIMMVPYIWGCIFSLSGFWLSFYASNSRSLTPNTKYFYYFLSILLYIISFATYQPTGTFFSGMIVFYLLSSNIEINKNHLKRAYVLLGLGILAIILYFALFRIYLHFTSADLSWLKNSYDIRNTHIDLSSYLLQVVPSLFIVVMHLWNSINVGQTDYFFYLILGTITIGIYINFYREISQNALLFKNNILYITLKVLLIFFCLALTTIQNLKYPMIESRLLPSSYFTISILFLLGLNNIIELTCSKYAKTIITLIMGSMLILFGFMAEQRILNYFVYNSITELRFVQAELHNYIAQNKALPKYINIVSNKQYKFINVLKNVQSGAAECGDNLIVDDIIRPVQIVRQLLRESQIDPAGITIRVIEHPNSYVKPETLEVNMYRIRIDD